MIAQVHPDIKRRRWPAPRPLPKVTYRFGYVDRQIGDLLKYDPRITRLVQETSMDWGNRILSDGRAGFTIRMASRKSSDLWTVAIAITALGIPDEYTVRFEMMSRRR